MPFSSHPGETNPFFGKTHTDEAKKSISLKNKGRVVTTILRKIRAENANGSNNSQYGKRFKFVTDGNVTKKLPIDEVDAFLSSHDEFSLGNPKRKGLHGN